MTGVHRSKALPDETLLRMLLWAVYHHPWTSIDLVIAYGGLTSKEARRLCARALSERLVEHVTMMSARRKPSRCYALTEAGADRLGETRQERAFLQDALLRSHHLDTLRYLLKSWAKDFCIPWALSPFQVQSADMHLFDSETTKRRDELESPDMWQRLRALRLSGAGCIKVDKRYINFVMLVDPGEISLAWFFNQFRNFHRWGQRPEFRNRKASFPVFLLLAANQTRLEQMIYLWRAAAIWKRGPERLLATTRWAGINNPDGAIWFNENYRRVLMWSGATGALEPSPCPDRLPARDPAHRPPFVGPGQEGALPASAPSRRSALEGSPGSKTIFRCHRELTLSERSVLETIGRYPLLKKSELAELLGVTKPFISRCVKSLQPLTELVKDANGLILSSLGLRLLAGQAGLNPAIYAQLRRWPVAISEGPGRAKTISLSMEYLVTRRHHTRFGLDFMIGMYRAARSNLSLRVISWDQESIYIFKNRHGPLPLPGKEKTHRRVVPDAVGAVCVLTGGSMIPSTYLTTEFWLEIDRGQLRGARLRRKLAQYYLARGGLHGAMGWLPRLLIVVDDDDEQRAQAIARRIRQLDRMYGRDLDVLITRRDLLRSSQGYLDPTRKAWRSPQDWATLTYAFNGLPVLTAELTGAARLRFQAARVRKRS